MTKKNKLARKARGHIQKSTRLLQQASEEIQNTATSTNVNKQLSTVEEVADTQEKAQSELEQALDAAKEIIEEREYSSHRDQILGAQPTPERIESLTKCLIEAFSKVITYKEVPFIVFEDLNVDELANAFINYP